MRYVLVLLLLAVPARAQLVPPPGMLLDPRGPGWQAKQDPVSDPGIVLADAKVAKPETPADREKAIEAGFARAAAAAVEPATPVPPGAANLTVTPPTSSSSVVPPSCAQCARDLAGQSQAKGWPTWATVVFTVVGVAATGLETLHSFGVIGK